MCLLRWLFSCVYDNMLCRAALTKFRIVECRISFYFKIALTNATEIPILVRAGDADYSLVEMSK